MIRICDNPIFAIMRAEEFVKSLSNFVPDIQELMDKFGYDEESSRMIRNDYLCSPKENPKGQAFSDPILELIRTHDISTLNISDISFNDPPEETDQYFVVGYVLDRELAISKETGEVHGVNPIDREKVVWDLAKDSESFMDGLEFMLHWGAEVEDLPEDEIEEFTKSQLLKLGNLIGGEDYLEYYRYIYDSDE